jgi:hypothetical protein
MADAIFIHAMWRTGSTYLWSKFREQAVYRAYYEPLNEALLYTRRGDHAVADHHPSQHVLRHPLLHRPYFDEYPARADGRLTGFDETLPYSRYCLSAEDVDEPLSSYIDGLVAYARTNGQVPVLQFNRSLLRSHWLRERYSGLHILLVRDPNDVWVSLRAQSPYFLAAICLIVSKNADHPWMRPFARHWDLPSAGARKLSEQFEFFGAYAREMGNDLLPLFHAFYVYTIIHSAEIAEVVIDMTQASADAEARGEVECALRANDIQLDLSDCKLPVHERLPNLESLEADTARFLAFHFPVEAEKFSRLSFRESSECSRIGRLLVPALVQQGRVFEGAADGCAGGRIP